MKPVKLLSAVATAFKVAISSLSTAVTAVMFALAFAFASFVAGGVLAISVNPVIVFCVILALQFITPFFGGKRMHNALFAGLYREAWDREIIKRFNTADETGWRAGIRDIGKYFSMLQDGETVAVNLTYFGVSPDVLIDNTAYPIAIQALDGENIVVNVTKFQTSATPVTDDEVMGLNYDKIKTVQESHAVVIEEQKNAKALHNVAPASNIAAMPVLNTTGDLDTGRRILVLKDLITLRSAIDKLLHPKMGRRLILCKDHVNDLLLQDQKFKDQYYNYTDGKIANMYGFDVYESSVNPYYAATAKTKLAFAGVPINGTHTEASLYMHTQRVVQGKGFTKAYLSASAQDPLYQRTLLNYRHYDIVTRYKNEGAAAICSAVV